MPAKAAFGADGIAAVAAEAEAAKAPVDAEKAQTAADDAADPSKAEAKRAKAAGADPSANKSATQADTPDSQADARAALPAKAAFGADNIAAVAAEAEAAKDSADAAADPSKAAAERANLKAAEFDASSPADVADPSTTEWPKQARAADPSKAAAKRPRAAEAAPFDAASKAPDAAGSRSRRKPERLRPQNGSNITLPTPTGSQAALLGKSGKPRSCSAPGIICFDMATASRGGKPAPALLSESRTDLNSDSEDDVPLAKRGKTRDDRPDAQLKDEDGAVSKTESILDALRFTDQIEREQVGSILHSLQERGLKLDLDACVSEGKPSSSKSLAGPASESPRLCQIRACIDTPSYHTVYPGTEVTVWLERGRLRDTIYNSPLFRQANAISDVNSRRKRKPFDQLLEQPVPVSKKGEHFGYSFPDRDGKVVCFLIVERAAYSAKEWLAISAENWRHNGQIDERVRGFLQLAVHGANLLREHSVVLGDVKDSTIGVNQDGKVVFQGSGNSVRYDESSVGQILQRRTTSFMSVNNVKPAKTRAAEKMFKGLLRGRLAKASAVSKKLPRNKCNRKGTRKGRNSKDRKGARKVDQLSNLPLDKQPNFLSPTKIAETWQGVVATSKGLASLGDGSVHFKKVGETSPESAESREQLSFLEASQRDMYGLLRTGLMMFNPVDEANPGRWEQEATAAEASQDDMKLFLTKHTAANGPSQTHAVDRAAQFFFAGFKSLNPSMLRDHPFLTLPIHAASTYQQIFNGNGFRVTGGEMDGAVGAPQEFSHFTVKDVVVKEQKGMGAGLLSAAGYETGELITFYYGKARRGREILGDPPGRYVLAILPMALYANGEFSEKLTLAKLAEKKAMGVCINAANNLKDRNCTIQRLKSTFDSEGNIWTPIVASRPIQPGEYFGVDYGPEAANGRSFSL